MIYSYKFASSSATALAEALEIKRIKHENSSFVGSEDKIVINWGSSQLPEEVSKCEVVNKAEQVALVSDKLKFFNLVKEDLPIPEYTTGKDVAHQWIKEGKTVLCRTILNGHSGEGIFIMTDEQEFLGFNHTPFKFYVKYIPKKDEYRVHVVGGKVIDFRRKARRKDWPDELTNWKVRSHENGFVFVKNDVNPPDEVFEVSTNAISLAGLDFGAVDVIWNEFSKKAYVLEINTAPGLEGSTVESYKKGFEDLFYSEPKYTGKKYRSKRIELEQTLISNQPDWGATYNDVATTPEIPEMFSFETNLEN